MLVGRRLEDGQKDVSAKRTHFSESSSSTTVARATWSRQASIILYNVSMCASTDCLFRVEQEIWFWDKKNPNAPALNCAVIIKQVDEKTRSKTSINDLLRD